MSSTVAKLQALMETLMVDPDPKHRDPDYVIARSVGLLASEIDAVRRDLGQELRDVRVKQ